MGLSEALVYSLPAAPRDWGVKIRIKLRVWYKDLPYFAWQAGTTPYLFEGLSCI